jgi:DNA-binding IclR family transcriptional regulator
MSEPQERASGIQVIDRAVCLMQALARYPHPVSLKVLAAECGLHASTAHRILAVLGTHHWVDKPSEGYALGSALVRLAARARPAPRWREIALPILNELCEALGESVNLTVREGDEVVYVERSVPNRMMRVEQVIGTRAPLHVTSVGKILLGAEGATAISHYAERTGLLPLTKNTIRQTEALIDACLTAAQRGFAFDNEEAEIGVGCLGVLVRDADGVPVAGLSISSPIERRQDQWVTHLQVAAKKIEARL